MDRVVSSYTPTLAQLTRARDLSRGRGARDGGQVLILAPDSDLRYAPDEADMVTGVFPDSQRLDGDAGAESCLHGISRSAVLHFVGHGQASEYRGAGGGSPQLGGLQISPAGQPAFLSARELTDLPLASARFAYLSVCESATPDRYVPDELTHPAAVLHFGGFPHVIATLQAVPDSSGTAVAASIYAALVRKGMLDEHRSAEALHNTLHALRRDEPGNTAPWTTYMHLGP
jgi:CHAT domain-containing protein